MDLVVLNEHTAFDASDLQSALEALVHRQSERPPALEAPGAVFILRADLVAVEARSLLHSRQAAGSSVASHGQGYSRFEHVSHGISLALLQYVPLDDPIKMSRLTITNQSGRPRRLSITGYAEWVRGASRAASAPCVVTEIAPGTHAMLIYLHCRPSGAGHFVESSRPGSTMS